MNESLCTNINHTPQKPTRGQSVTGRFANWCKRQSTWFEEPITLSLEQTLRLRKGGVLKNTQHLACVAKITTSWMATEDYPYEQRIDYRFDPLHSLTKLGLVAIYLERAPNNTCRIGIECQSPDHYAVLHALMDDTALYSTQPMRLSRWMMQAYEHKAAPQDFSSLYKLINVLSQHCKPALAPLWLDLEAHIRTLPPTNC